MTATAKVAKMAWDMGDASTVTCTTQRTEWTHAKGTGDSPTWPRPDRVVEFSWVGDDEGDFVSGRGWANLSTDGSLEGHLFFHRGDASAFWATR